MFISTRIYFFLCVIIIPIFPCILGYPLHNVFVFIGICSNTNMGNYPPMCLLHIPILFQKLTTQFLQLLGTDSDPLISILFIFPGRWLIYILFLHLLFHNNRSTGPHLAAAAPTNNADFLGILALQGLDVVIALEQGGVGGPGPRHRGHETLVWPEELNGSRVDRRKGEQ